MMKALLSLVAVVGLISVTAFGTPVNYAVVGTNSSSVSYGTLTYGYNSVPFQSAANIDPAGLATVLVQYGNVSLAAFQASAANVIDFNTADAANGVKVTSVVAQLDATTSIAFTNFGNTSNTELANSMTSYGLAGAGGRGRLGAFSGTASYQALGFDSGAAVSWNGATPASSWIDFDVIPSDPTKGVSSIGFCIDGAGNGSGRSLGNGLFRFGLSDGSIASVPYIDTGLANNNDMFVGYQAPDGLTITHVQMEQTSVGTGSGTPPANLDDLSFTVVPEPATMGLLLIGGIGALLKRRK